MNTNRLNGVLSSMLLVTLSAGLVACLDSDSTSPTIEETIEIGALVAFSGDHGATGAAKLAALQVAVEDANEEFADQGLDFHLNYGDTQSEPAAAAVLLNSYLLQDIRIIVGPNTSAEVSGVQGQISASNSFLISPGSTSMALANADDHIFRLAPTDSSMVAGLVDLMWAQGRRYLVLVHRDDSWGNSVATEMEAQFTEKGGTIISSNEYWGLRTSTVTEVLREVEAEILAAPGIQSLSEVAFHLTSLNEGFLLFEVAADSVPFLGDIAWYGSDGFVQDEYILENAKLAAFADQTDYTAPIFRVEAAGAFEDVVARIETAAGMTAGTYDLLTYDALRIAARTLAQAGSDATYEALEAALGDVIQTYDGISGQVELNAMGDQAGGAYDFYTIQSVGGSYQWVVLNEG